MDEEKRDEGYVPVILASLLQPIADLFSQMDARGPRGPNEVQASGVENGYAASIIVLSIVVVESALNRTRYVRKEHEREHPIDTLSRLGARDIADDAEELFVVRDAIAHNHLWDATFRWDDEVGMRLSSARRLPGYGDKKFERAVDPARRMTKRLGLDVFPTRVHRGTAVVVLKKCVEILQFLESLDRRYVYLSQPWRVKVSSNLVPFYDWVKGLKESA